MASRTSESKKPRENFLLRVEEPTDPSRASNSFPVNSVTTSFTDSPWAGDHSSNSDDKSAWNFSDASRAVERPLESVCFGSNFSRRKRFLGLLVDLVICQTFLVSATSRWWSESRWS